MVEPITIGVAAALFWAFSQQADAVSHAQVNPQKLVGRTLDKGGSPVPMTPDRVRTVEALLTGWRGSALTPQEKVMFLAFGWHETMWNPALVGHVDGKWGSSYTIFQLRRNVELKGALEALRLRFDEVVPPEGIGWPALSPFVINQARCAAWLAQQKGIVALRESTRGNDDLECVSLAAKWGGCGGGTWQGILNSPIAGPVLGGRIPASGEVEAMNRALKAAAKAHGQSSSCAVGVLNRLVTYRTLRSILL